MGQRRSFDTCMKEIHGQKDNIWDTMIYVDLIELESFGYMD